MLLLYVENEVHLILKMSKGRYKSLISLLELAHTTQENVVSQINIKGILNIWTLLSYQYCY